MSFLSRLFRSRQGRPIPVLYGSQTGNAELLARTVAKRVDARLRAGGFQTWRAEAQSLDRFASITWAETPLALFVTSTYGEGELPDNSARFWQWLNQAGVPLLPHLRYAVLGLGDRSYPHFCGAARQLDGRLTQLGAQRLLPLEACDVEYHEPAEVWTQQLERLLEKGVDHLCESVTPKDRPVSINPIGTVGLSAATTSAPEKQGRTALRVVSNDRLTGVKAERETRHVVLSLEGSDLTYEPGDSLGVWPTNPSELVAPMLRATGDAVDELVQLPDGARVPLTQALTERLELVRLSSRILEALRSATDDSRERARLDHLLDPIHHDGAAYLAESDLTDLLRDFPHSALPPQALVDALSPIKPRFYSLSSAPSVHENEAHLCVSVLRRSHRELIRPGVGSSFLAGARPGNFVDAFVQSARHFRLPAAGTPVVMIGAGTGVAPFRAFLHERRKQSERAPSWLFFGARSRADDFLYGQELLAHQRDGTLAELDLAFSREQSEKVFVQHLVVRRAPALWAWVQDGASVYVCGNKKGMAGGVEEALLSVARDQGQLSRDGALDWLSTMREQKRYQRDVY